MGKRKCFFIFVVVLFLGCFGINLNICFADSTQVSKDNIEKYNFSSPAAEKSFLEFGQIDKASSLTSTVKMMLSSLDDGDSPIPAARSTGCSTGCSSGCSSGCSMGCSSGCSMGCSMGCR